jgi:interferon-induced GTP-binding protein Mx1
MSQYVEQWRSHCQWCVGEVTSLAISVANQMAALVLAPYPQLVHALSSVVGSVCASTHDECVKLVDDIVTREKDPFTLNEFLTQWINKLRFD